MVIRISSWVLAGTILLCVQAGEGMAFSSGSPEKADVVFEGVAENHTIGQSAKLRLSLRQDGEILEGTIATEAPLSGSGLLKGWRRNGMCSLRGRTDEGIYLVVLGECSSAGYSGVYTAIVDGESQEGAFMLKGVSGKFREIEAKKK
jgi:hypothetical protein